VRGPVLAMAFLVMARSGTALAAPPAELAPPRPPSSPVNAAPVPPATPAAVPSPRASSGAKFAVVGIGPASLASNLAAALEAAAAAGLVASGAEVVARPSTGPAAGSCDTPACLRGLASASGARYLLRGTCAIEASTYRVHLELVDGMSGTVAAARGDTCEICTEHDVVEATNIAASALKATLDRTPKIGAQAGAQIGAQTGAPAGAPAKVPPAADLSKGDAASRTHAAARPGWLRVAPWVAFAAAAGAIGAGAWYLSLNGNGTDRYYAEPDMSARFYDTGWQGGAWIGAGVVAAALGVLALTWTPSPGDKAASQGATRSVSVRPTGLSLSPAGVAAWTRF
jgi:hypothetical protein